MPPGLFASDPRNIEFWVKKGGRTGRTQIYPAVAYCSPLPRADAPPHGAKLAFLARTFELKSGTSSQPKSRFTTRKMTDFTENAG